MADLPITSDEGAQPVSLIDPESQNDAVINSDGSLNAVPADSFKATYSAVIRALVTAASATDIFTITGSATKLVKVRRILVSGSQSGNGVTPIVLTKRSALNTGGTSSTQTNVPHDSNDAAATAVVKAYTANPTALGASVGNLASLQISFNNGLASGLEDKIDYLFSDNIKGCILRNANENLAVNLAGTSVTSPAVNITITWTEE